MKAYLHEQPRWKQLSPSLPEFCWEQLKFHGVAVKRKKKSVEVHNNKLTVNFLFLFIFPFPICV